MGVDSTRPRLEMSYSFDTRWIYMANNNYTPEEVSIKIKQR